jgi:Fe-S cluster assembly protein SufD
MADVKQPDNHTTHLPPLVELSADHIAAAARDDAEPSWLIERRVEAWNFFAQTLPPEWRRTDLTRLEPESIQPSAQPQGTAIQWDESLASQGVVFTTLKAALQTHEQHIRDRLGTLVEPRSHKFSALRAALWQDGVFLYVPGGVEVAVPLRVCYTLPDGSRSIFPYSLVIVEPNARATFIEEYYSNATTAPALAGPTTEIFAGPGSSIRFVSVQQWGHGVYHIGGQINALQRDASSEWVSVSLGSQVQHIEAEARMQGDGSNITWYGATFAAGEQRLLTGPWLRHIGANTTSHMDFKTVVTGEGYSIFDGMIKIEKDSSGTSTRLEEHAIHLTEKARSDSIPGLKIDTNDVAQAGHASTSGDVDEEQLFYMQSRGIAKDDAIHMIVMGWFEPALNAIPVEDLRETLTTAIEAKI